MKNDVKNVYCETPESKSNKNEARIHFTWSLAVLSTFKPPLNGLCENFKVHHKNGPAVGKLKSFKTY